MFGVYVKNLDNNEDVTLYCPQVKLMELCTFANKGFVYTLMIPGDRNTANGLVFRTDDNVEHIMCNLDTTQIKDILDKLSTDDTFDLAELPYQVVPVSCYEEIFKNNLKNRVCAGNLTDMDISYSDTRMATISNIYEDYRISCFPTYFLGADICAEVVDYRKVWPNVII